MLSTFKCYDSIRLPVLLRFLVKHNYLELGVDDIPLIFVLWKTGECYTSLEEFGTAIMIENSGKF